MDSDKSCYICYENDGEYGCNRHLICGTCFDMWKKECWKMPHRFLFCPYCLDILQHEKDDRDVF